MAIERVLMTDEFLETRCDHFIDDGYADVRNKCLTATSLLYKGYRYLDRRLLDFRIRRAPRVRPSELRVA